MKLNGKLWQASGTVAAAATAVLILPESGDASIALIPAAGGSALVEVTIAPLEEVQAGSASVRWFPWPKGSVTAAAEDTRMAPATALRITAATQPCRYEFSQRAV